jgi:hypothetical protein
MVAGVCADSPGTGASLFAAPEGARLRLLGLRGLEGSCCAFNESSVCISGKVFLTP